MNHATTNSHQTNSSADASARLQTLPGASLSRRLAAMVYDSFLLLAVFMAVTAAAIAITAVLSGPGVVQGDFSNLAIQGTGYRLALIASWFGFFSWFWCFSGQTLGMQAWRIKIVDLNDEARTPTFPQTSRRFAMALLSALCLGLGYLAALRSPLGLSWHDRVSGTRVVLLPKR